MEEILQEVNISEDVTDYFEIYDTSKAKQFIKTLYDRNSRNARSYWLERMFDCLSAGVEKDITHFAICEANAFRTLLKKMISTPLMKFAGIDAVSNFVEKLREESDALHIGGFYDPSTNLLFVVVENPMFEITDDVFFNTLLHEMCHYFAANNARQFRNSFREKYLVPFYTHMFSELQFAVRHERNEEVASVMGRAFAYHMLSLERFFTNQKVSKMRMLKYVDRTYGRLAELDDTVAKLWYYLLNDSFGSRKYADVVRSVLSSCYKAIGVDDNGLFVYYQELLIPSEVIAIASNQKKKQPEYIQMLRDIW